MKIFHIDQQRSWTGQIGRQFRIVQGLRAHGHEVGVIANQGSEIGIRARNAGIETIEYPMRGWRFYTTLFQLGHRLRDKGIDIIHSHGPRDHVMSLLAGKIAGVKHFVRTKHNHTRLRRGAVSRIPYNRCDHVVAISHFVEDVLMQDKVGSVVRIPTSVNTEHFAPRLPNPDLAREFGIREGEFVIGNVSSLHARKGIEELLRAFKSLEKEPFYATLRCLLVGKRWENWKDLVSELELGGKVLFPGFHENVNEVMALFDIFVLPSHEEALGTSVLEAMAMERPVIAGRTGGLIESVAPATGILVTPKEVAPLAEAIRTLCNDTATRKSMGKAGRQRIVEHYSETIMVRKTIGMYEDILGIDKGAG